MDRKQRAPRRSRARWAALVTAYEASGMSQRAFCLQQQVSPSTFGRWISRLGTSTTTPLAPVTRPAALFVEVQLPVASTTPLMRVQVGELSVEFDTLVPPAWVAELAALREAKRC